MIRIICAAALAVFNPFPTVGITQQDTAEPRTAVDTITIAELRDHVFYLASDYLEGRLTGSEGYAKAAEYVLAQLHHTNVEPIIPGPNESMSFYQQVPMVKAWAGKGNSLAVMQGSTTVKLVHGKDYLLNGLESCPEIDVITGVVFLGHGISEPDAGWDDYADMDVDGKLVICTLSPPVAGGKALLPDDIMRKYSRWFEAINMKVRAAQDHGATAIAFLPTPFFNMSWDRLRSYTDRPHITYLDSSGHGIPRLILSQEGMVSIFRTSGYNPLKAIEKDTADLKRFELEGVEIRLRVKPERTDATSPNIVAWLPGTDPEKQNEVITIGAHLDHLGVRDGVVYNGADDNAGGVAAVLEIAEALSQMPTRRPVLFLFYVAEEEGLYGARHFVTHSPIPVENLLININLDMVSRWTVEGENPVRLYALGADKICPKLQEYLSKVNESRYRLPLVTDDPYSFFKDSDHYVFHEAGVPALFLTSDDHPDYHKPGDDAEKIIYENLQQVSKLTYDYIVAIGNAEDTFCERAGR